MAPDSPGNPLPTTNLRGRVGHLRCALRLLPLTSWCEAGSSADSETGPECQDEQAGDCYCQADLRPLTYEGHAAAQEDLVAQRRVGEPANAGTRVAPGDEATHQHRDEAHRGQHGGRYAGGLVWLTFPGFVVFPHAGESSGASRRRALWVSAEQPST
jgi:hypothetical protein